MKKHYNSVSTEMLAATANKARRAGKSIPAGLIKELASRGDYKTA